MKDVVNVSLCTLTRSKLRKGTVVPLKAIGALVTFADIFETLSKSRIKTVKFSGQAEFRERSRFPIIFASERTHTLTHTHHS